MKSILKVTLIALLILTVNSTGQQQSKEQLEEARFAALLKRAKTNINKTQEVQKRAVQKAAAIVSQAKTKIVYLNSNVKELKVDLHETTKKLDYATDTNVGIKFILLPISDTQKIRQ
jgi:flagellar hook-basal body complex protein FliE